MGCWCYNEWLGRGFGVPDSRSVSGLLMNTEVKNARQGRALSLLFRLGAGSALGGHTAVPGSGCTGEGHPFFQWPRPGPGAKLPPK